LEILATLRILLSRELSPPSSVTSATIISNGKIDSKSIENHPVR